jgi:hypothetical protein
MYVRSDQFLIARTTIACPTCARATEVIALVLPPGHETEESDETDDVAEPRWMTASHAAFLFLVDKVSPGVEAWLHEAAKHYGVDGTGAGLSGMRNHCTECGSTISDHDLFNEPGHAFLPANSTQARAVSLAPVDRPIAATADGYAHEPEFFEFMTRL